MVMLYNYGLPETITGEVNFPFMKPFLTIVFTGISSKKSRRRYLLALRLLIGILK
jgi:hypothetical protein